MTMRCGSLIAAALWSMAPSLAAAQDVRAIASAVDRVRDGDVRLQYASRSGACGDGRDVVAFGSVLFARSMESWGRWNTTNCQAGPVRVTIAKRDGQIVEVRTQIGGAWPEHASNVVRLPAREAAAYFLAIVPVLEASGSSKGRLLLPAVLADSADVVQPLLAIARDERRRQETRRHAVQFAGMLGDASVVPALAALARADHDDDQHSKKGGLGGAAMAALASVRAGAGVPTLIELTRSTSAGQRRNAVFWLAQTGDPRAPAAVQRVIEDPREEVRVRKHAIFSLAHAESVAPATFAWLRSFWSRTDDDALKESIVQAIAQDDAPDAARWLIDRVRDARESLQVRKQALFWAGQRKATPTALLAAVARDSEERSLREHGVFVLAQRDEGAALDALVEMARHHRDPGTRKQAIFWLGQSDDPRAERLLRDLITR